MGREKNEAQIAIIIKALGLLLLLLRSRKLLLQSENLMTVVISIDSSNKHIWCCCFYTIRVIVVAQIDVIFVTNLFSSTHHGCTAVSQQSEVDNDYC